MSEIDWVAAGLSVILACAVATCVVRIVLERRRLELRWKRIVSEQAHDVADDAGSYHFYEFYRILPEDPYPSLVVEDEEEKDRA